MEKILLVVNARQPDAATIDFACDIALAAGNKLTGLLIDNLFAPVKTQAVPQAASPGTALLSRVSQTTDMEQAVEDFRLQCRQRGVETEVYLDKGEPIQEVIYESRFADLLILDPSLDFYGAGRELPSHFAREILGQAECPVLLAPGTQSVVDELVFCYDGSWSSVYALKLFTYLLPQYRSKRAVLLEVKPGSRTAGDDRHRLLQWLQAHYTNVQCQTLDGEAREELFAYFFMKTGKLAVLGSYGRSLLSNFIRSSTADALIRAVDLPVFIAHPK